MNVRQIDHLCIAVRDLEAARKVWEPVLGKTQPDERYRDEPEQIEVARYYLDGVGFELMQSTAEDGPVAKWIENHGEGIMLVSFKVDSTRQAVGELEKADYPFIPNPRPVAGDATEKIRPFRESEFAFLHPKMMNGALVELID